MCPKMAIKRATSENTVPFNIKAPKETFVLFHTIASSAHHFSF